MTELFLGGGGTIANTISTVPEAIDRMLGNYKKMAIIDTNIDLDFQTKPNAIYKFKIPLNLSFNPKILFISINHYDMNYIKNWITTFNNPNTSIESFYTFKLFDINKNSVSLEVNKQISSRQEKWKIKKIIAIE